MQFIKPEDILAATDGGLNIILDLYPQARPCVNFPSRKFKTRNEDKTASTSLKKHEDGTWLMTDWGGDGKTKNGILAYQDENGWEYGRTLQHLALKYGVLSDEAKKEVLRPDYSERPANPDEEDGTWDPLIRESWTDAEIETLFSKRALDYVGWNKADKKQSAYSKIVAVLKRYHFHPISRYTVFKNRKALEFSSTDIYPIFLIHEPTFKKLYQPRHWDKAKRFMYLPGAEGIKDYILGLEQAGQEVQRLVKQQEDDFEPADIESETPEKKKKKEPKLPEIILCSGGSDALNIALMGYWVVWMNSETAKLHKTQYRTLEKYATNVYQMPDIDHTGRRVAHDVAMEYLDMFTIELPENLKRFKDARGNPCKDVRDYLNHHTAYEFRELVRTALPYRFWDVKNRYEGKGENRLIVGRDYQFNNVQAYNFLGKNGFFRMRSELKKTGYIYLQIIGNTVKEIEANDIKNHVHAFLQGRQMETELRNAMYRSTQLGEASLSNLPVIEIDFSDFDKHSQYLFFSNKTLQISGNGITEHKPGAVNKYIWEEQVIDHTLKLEKEPFSINFDATTGDYDIAINNSDCLFLKYLIQTSRIHWRAELEERQKGKTLEEEQAYLSRNRFAINGENLTAEERKEQEQHLINKLFCIGYLLHRFKDRSKPWCVFAMDNNINDDGGSYGGSGKSLLFNIAIPQVLKKNFYLGGRNPKLTDNPHIYDGLSEHHRFILVDDADEYLNFKFFFDALTGDLKVNPKNVQPFTIKFDKVGKFAITSNFTLRDIDLSTERRLLYTVFSDYYHNAGESADYNETRRVSDDFGKNLFDDFDTDEYNRFYNTCAYALRFYLSATAKIAPPMGNVSKRNLITAMGYDFFGWADVYFANDEHINKPIIKELAFEDYRFKYKSIWKTQRFTKAMKAWCNYHGYIYNPKEMCDKNGRIIQKVDDYTVDRDRKVVAAGGDKVAKEMMFIRTNSAALPVDDTMKDLPF